MNIGWLGPRTCEECDITSALYWKVQQQLVPIVYVNRERIENLAKNKKRA